MLAKLGEPGRDMCTDRGYRKTQDRTSRLTGRARVFDDSGVFDTFDDSKKKRLPQVQVLVRLTGRQ